MINAQTIKFAFASALIAVVCFLVGALAVSGKARADLADYEGFRSFMLKSKNYRVVAGDTIIFPEDSAVVKLKGDKEYGPAKGRLNADENGDIFVLFMLADTAPIEQRCGSAETLHIRCGDISADYLAGLVRGADLSPKELLCEAHWGTAGGVLNLGICYTRAAYENKGMSLNERLVVDGVAYVYRREPPDDEPPPDLREFYRKLLAIEKAAIAGRRGLHRFSLKDPLAWENCIEEIEESSGYKKASSYEEKQKILRPHYKPCSLK